MPSIVRKVAFVALGALVAPSFACDLSRDEHEAADEVDLVADLAAAVERGERELAWEPRYGRLLAVLDALEIPPSSQVLVFSKTSLQRDWISPRTPRAIYFSDTAYVGWIPGAPWIEIAGAGARAASFFVVSQDREAHDRPRARVDCLQCHESALTQGVPGFLVRSVQPARDGRPIVRFGSFSIDHRSPYEQRWGGWFVSGVFPGTHLGNRFADASSDALAFRRADAVTPPDLASLVDLARYPRPTSDVVALLVLEHQVQAHNLIARTALDADSALLMRATMNRLDGRPEDAPRKETTERLEFQARALLDYFLFVEEAPLEGAVRGPSEFAAEFAARGPRDEQGRSLRDLRLRRRLFRWPLSYLVHSRAFGALPDELRRAFWRRLGALLAAPDEEEDRTYEHLTPNARRALREHLLETHADARWLDG